MKKVDPINIVRYILFKYTYDGDLITNLKMQKILYYVYVWFLVNFKKPCFDEKFQAWPNGPVLRSVYKELKGFQSSPIETSFANLQCEQDLAELKNLLGKDLVCLIDEVYEEYGRMSAFELVNLTHKELAWLNARKGLKVEEPSNNELLDADILSQHGKEKEKV